MSRCCLLAGLADDEVDAGWMYRAVDSGAQDTAGPGDAGAEPAGATHVRVGLDAVDALTGADAAAADSTYPFLVFPIDHF